MLQVDGVEAHPSLQALTTQIIARTVAIEVVDETQDLTVSPPPSSNGNSTSLGQPTSNGRTPSSEQARTAFIAPETVGTNGNGTASLSLEQSPEVETSHEDVADIVLPSSNDADISTDTAHGGQHDSDEPTAGATRVDQLAEKLNLSERETSMLKAILAQAPRGEWFSTGQIVFSKTDFVSEDAFRNAKAKLFVTLRDGVLIHNGEERRRSRYMIDTDQLAVPEADTSNGSVLRPEERVVDAFAEPKSDSQTTTEASTNEVKTIDTDVPPAVTYDGDIVENRRKRRNDIIAVENLDELNDWIAAKNPYGSLPKISIETPRLLKVNGRDFGLSDEQRELLNILLANYGKPLTQADITGMGFADVVGSSARLKAFSGTADRFLTAKVDDDGNRLMLGDKLNARGYMLNPVFQIVDNREIVKKN